MPKPLMLLLLVCLVTKNVAAQSISDTAVYGNAAGVISRYFMPSLREHSPLYNGTEYIEYAQTLREGHPFFQTNQFVNGELYFDGLVFHQVPMLYDLVKKQLIIRDFRDVYNIVLPADKIRQFTLSGHRFFHIGGNEVNRLQTGFYDRLVEGKVGLFAKREKQVVERKSASEIDAIIDSSISYYILKNEIYHRVGNKGDLVTILKDRKKEMQQYLRNNKVRIKKNSEGSMIAAIGYYNKLIN